MPRWRWIVAGAVSFALLAGACGTDRATPPSPGPPPGGGVTLPPSAGQQFAPAGVGAISSIYDPVLATQGVRITRAAPIDQRGRSYEVSERGDFLALYTRPLSAEGWTPDRYAEAMVPLVGLFARDVFARWPGIEAFDVCLEPAGVPATGAGTEEATVWQVTVQRPAVGDVDWATGTLDDLLSVANSNGDGGISVVVREPVVSAPTFRAAADRVGGLPAPSATDYPPPTAGP